MSYRKARTARRIDCDTIVLLALLVAGLLPTRALVATCIANPSPISCLAFVMFLRHSYRQAFIIHARSSRATTRPSAGVPAGTRRTPSRRRRTHRSRQAKVSHVRSSRATAPPTAGVMPLIGQSPMAARRCTPRSRPARTYARSSRATTRPSAGEVTTLAIVMAI